MKRVYLVLMTLCLSFSTWAHSPALTALLDELDAQYSKTYTTGMKEDDKRDITKLAYFLQHIEAQGTPEKLKLDAYLTGLHNGIYDTINMQRRMNAPTWFCMRDTMIMNPKRHPDFLKNLIWDVLEEIANEDPTRFSKVDYINAFGLAIDSVTGYGLQTRYPCFEIIPKSLQLNGWKY
ncbi:hypothetical protein OPW39_17340 [Vibrio europaeus]|uniref:hypothetical protein n=1 Tax=Vibrio europaeus TaxID=300876 RepID=UPI00233ECC7C|nr:hypothetical protein [Vibrio europaeus]MDC5870568.1 hypothetical protein [Vibrio europaeus]